MDLIVFQSLGLKKIFYHPFVSLWIFCLILFLLDFLCNFALLIINIITKILSSIQSIHRTVLSDNLEHYQLIRLQEIHSALLLQQEEILCHLADIEDHIQHLTRSDSNSRNELHQTLFQSLLCQNLNILYSRMQLHSDHDDDKPFIRPELVNHILSSLDHWELLKRNVAIAS